MRAAAVDPVNASHFFACNGAVDGPHQRTLRCKQFRVGKWMTFISSCPHEVPKHTYNMNSFLDLLLYDFTAPITLAPRALVLALTDRGEPVDPQPQLLHKPEELLIDHNRMSLCALE